MQPGELLEFLQHAGRDPSRLIFEDELTGVHNRRFLHSYLEHKVHWDTGADYPFSLLILDLDWFKDINDTHGHTTGDQVLTWVATVLREVGGENGLPVRFGGDEFILMLPQTDGQGAREVAARLLQRVQDRPFRLRDAGVAVPVTLSIGVATAPADGESSRLLMQAADSALYHAKQSGRNQAATAADVDPSKVFPRTALHRLLVSGISGRDRELSAVSAALLALSRSQSQFILFEGAPGMGKTTLLETVGRNLAGDAGFAVVQTGGDAQAGYRPYHVVTSLLVALLNRRDDKGAALLQSLSAEDMAGLSQIVPQVTEGTPVAPAGDDGAQRQQIFGALARLLRRVVDGRPLVLLVDDLHLADEASLLLLRALFQSRKIPLCVLGATLEPLPLGRGEEAPPVERFYATRGRELGIQRLRLAALGSTDILDYLRTVFPNLRMPEGIAAELARITQGNPLFLGEIVRKLVADHRISLVGSEWVMAPVEAGYLPGSLEDIVREKITALDAEGHVLLEQASALGEDVPVSVLTGSSRLDEIRVFEFLDRAEALGLVSIDFDRNDEVMRFLGKRVLEISYGAIDEDRRPEIHEQVGTYQEGLYRQRLLPSASVLAYHFKRSANQDKAQRYERAQLAHARTLFDPDEAARYTTDVLDEEADGEDGLSPESVVLVPHVVRTFMMAVRSIQLYPPESKAIPHALQQFLHALEAVLVHDPSLRLGQERRALLANGQRLEVVDWTALADSLLELLDRFELQSIVFLRDITEEELRLLLGVLSTTRPDAISAGFWRATVSQQGFTHIEPHQVRYSKVARARSSAGRRPGAEDEPLEPEDLAAIPKILRALQAAAKVVKLYPVDTEPVARAVEQLHGTLQEVLGRRPTLTIAAVEGALLGNGVRLDTSGFAAVAGQAVELLDASGLESVTWFTGVPPTEIAVLLEALRNVPGAGGDRRYWDGVARDKGLTCLAFNYRRYARSVMGGLLQGTDGETEDATEGELDAAALERLSEDPLEVLQQALPQFGKELLVKGEHALTRRLLRRQFQDFAKQDAVSRGRTVQACQALIERLILGLQHRFAQLAAEFLLPALLDESEPQVLRDLGDLLYGMASTAVQFSDYELASRILLELRTRRAQLHESGGREGGSLASLLARRFDPAALKLLDHDLRSGQPDRHQQAAEVLGALGPVATPLLIDVIKQESDFRIRQLAARLLAETDPDAGDHIKRALVTEVIVEHRAHVLEVIDIVTRDLQLELDQCLHDPSARVRRAAFQLFERLGQDSLIPLVAGLANDLDPAVVRGAIRALSLVRSPLAVRALAQTLQTTRDPSVAALCCRALGQSDQATAIDALERVLRERRMPFFGRRWGAEVRAVAGLALRQISHAHATEVLRRYQNDRHPQVRAVARGLTGVVPAGNGKRPSGATPELTGELPPEL